MRIVPKFQVGGPMEGPAPEEEAMPQGADLEMSEAPLGGDPMMQIAQMFAQGLLNQDCLLLAQGALAFLLLISQASGQEQGEPVFRAGGSIVYRDRRNR